MKSIRYILGLVVLAGAMLVSSCTEEVDSTGIKEKVTEGIPVTAVLSYDASSASIVSRASAEEENAVTDLYVLIFNASNGSYESSAFATNDELDNMGRNKITLNTTTGEKKLYAVANTGSNTFAVGERTLKDDLDEFIATKPSLSEWLDFSMTMAEEQVAWGGGQGTFTMSGYFVAEADAEELKGDVLPGDGTCVITTAGVPSVSGKLQLVRVASQITFNITNARNSKGTFTPTGWEVHNVPKSLYMNRQTDAGTPENTDYFSQKGTLDQGSFNFYMPENRQTTAVTYSGSDLGKAQMNWREAYSTEEGAKVFTNAPAAGTYVVLHGTYSGKAGNPFNDYKDGDAQATVTYYIHLGYADGVNDFSIPRNAKYTYNITVAGVEDIIVEVINENQPSNPSDGHVMFYDAEIIEADAHYERREITLDCSMNAFICGIETAKTGFIYHDLADLKDTNRDIDWVHFMLKSRAEELKHRIVFPSAETKSEGLMDVAELTEYIKSDESNGEQAFYVYIAENYYEGMAYSKFANDEKGIGEAKSRRMMISISRDNRENSSVSSTRYIIQQKPITTIFNLADGAVSGGNPWGMEWSNENLSKTY
ncbi:MAG: DUF4906 domain-containing protein, partial [Tannerellaceae bacterium]|nr:DUF4906 domain-containing protein [Tannerellaceae bacterium]